AENILMSESIRHMRRYTRPGPPLAQGLRRKRQGLEQAAFGNGVFVEPVVVIGAIANDAHLQANPVLEVSERRRRVYRLIEDRRVTSIAHGEPPDVAIAAFGRVLDAQRRSVMVAG